MAAEIWEIQFLRMKSKSLASQSRLLPLEIRVALR